MKKTIQLLAILLLLASPCVSAQQNVVCGNSEPQQLSQPPITIPGLEAGPCITHSGFAHTPKGNLRIIWVFVDK